MTTNFKNAIIIDRLRKVYFAGETNMTDFVHSNRHCYSANSSAVYLRLYNSVTGFKSSDEVLFKLAHDLFSSNQ